ncbi:MAG: allantoinase AllB, partial [Caldisericaceae bacterium]
MIIKNANIIKEGNKLEQVDILIEEGKIKEVQPINVRKIDSKETEIIDATNLVAFPGFIDAHVHFDDPGYTEREDFYTGSMSAAKGGVTTIIDMPCTSIPEVTNLKNLFYKLEIVSKKAFVDFAFWGGVRKDQIATNEYAQTIKDLAKEGVVGLKVYTISGMKTYPSLNTEELAKVFNEAKINDLVVGVHAEDLELVDYFTKKMYETNRVDPKAWTIARNYEAEAIAILRSIALAKEIKNKLHIVHLSTSLGLKLIEMAKEEGVDITTETCPHYLIFNEDDLDKIGPILKTAPPVRKKIDSEYLLEGLKNGTLDFVTTDHAGGIFPKEKSQDSIFDNYAGIPGVQTRFNALFTFGYSSGKLTLEDLVRVLAKNPAKRFNLNSKGEIKVGFDADIVLVNPFESYIFDAERDLLCKNKYSPFNGFEFKGVIEKT